MDITREQSAVRGPKNKKQIGRIGKGDKIYIEDYAVTYLNQIARSPETKSGFAGLFGTCREVDGTKEYYIYAAIYRECETVLDGGLPREAVQKIMRQRGEMFAEYFFLGWAVVLGNNTGTLWENCYRSRMETLMGKPEVLMTVKSGTCEEHFYLYPTEMPKETEGYFIFYEENDAMQNFLIEWHGTIHKDKCDEEGDNVAESCRNYYKEKKAERFRTKLAGVLLTAAVLFLLFSAGVGVQNLNRYDKIQEVGQTLENVSGAETVLEPYEENSAIDLEEIGAIPVQHQNGESGNAEISKPGVDGQEVVLKEPNETVTDLAGEENVETGEAEEMAEEQQDTIMPENSEAEIGEENELPDETIAEETVVIPEEEPVVLPETAEDNETVSNEILQEYITYEVSKGDTLYGICVRFYGNLSRASEICSINNIENKDNILYGQKILLPR